MKREQNTHSYSGNQEHFKQTKHQILTRSESKTESLTNDDAFNSIKDQVETAKHLALLNRVKWTKQYVLFGLVIKKQCPENNDNDKDDHNTDHIKKAKDPVLPQESRRGRVSQTICSGWAGSRDRRPAETRGPASWSLTSLYLCSATAQQIC